MARKVQNGIHKIFINLGKRDDPGTQAWHQVAAKGIVKWTNGCPGTRHLQAKETSAGLEDPKDFLRCRVNIGDIPDPESTDHRIHGGIGEWQCPCRTRYPDHVTYTVCRHIAVIAHAHSSLAAKFNRYLSPKRRASLLSKEQKQPLCNTNLAGRGRYCQNIAQFTDYE
jgi:hypothetical protein